MSTCTSGGPHGAQGVAQSRSLTVRRMPRSRALLHLMLFLVMGGLAWAHGPSASLPTVVAAAQTIPAPTAARATIPPVAADGPQRLRIPAIGVDAAIESVGQTAAGKMGVPQESQNVAWYNAGVQPGAQGNAVISGHLDDRMGPAVFWRLRNLQMGDDVFVTHADGTEDHFQVIGSEAYTNGAAPLNKIFGFDLERDLNLITCDGSWDRNSQTYSRRLVVYTRLVPPAE